MSASSSSDKNGQGGTSATACTEDDEENQLGTAANNNNSSGNDDRENAAPSNNGGSNGSADGSGDVLLVSRSADTGNLGPGAYHVVPLGGSGSGGRTSPASAVTAAAIDGNQNGGGEEEDATIAVSATLVVEEENENHYNSSNNNPETDSNTNTNTNTGGASSSSQPPSSSNVTAVASTLITHATPVSSFSATSHHGGSETTNSNNINGNSDESNTNNTDGDNGGVEEAPVLSLVDQRVVDRRISQLEGEHRRTLRRRTLLGVAGVVLAMIIVVAVAVPLSSRSRNEDGDMLTSSDKLLETCGMAELKRRSTATTEDNTESARDGNPYEYYGMWSAISGGTIVVGSPGTEGSGPDGKVHKMGRVHIFEGRQVEEEELDYNNDGDGGDGGNSGDGSVPRMVWEEISTGALEPTERVTEYGLVASFGFRVALSGDVLAVTSFTDNAGFPGVGMVYVYRRHVDGNATAWVEEAIVVPPEDAMEDEMAMAVFGALVAVSGDTMAVASVLRDNARGAVYVYRRVVDETDGTAAWQYQAKLEASDGMEGDEFGSSLAMDGDTIVASSVWATNDDGDVVGKVYVFSKNDEGSWVETDMLTAFDAQANAEFGYFVDIVGDTIAVSAPFASSSGDAEPNGMVYVYRHDSADAGPGGNLTWIETAMLTADGVSEFGGSLSMHNEFIVVGAPSAPVGGGIFVYAFDGDDWTLRNKFQYPDTVDFGRSVGISETAVVATDPVYNRNGMAQSGAAFAVDYLANATQC